MYSINVVAGRLGHEIELNHTRQQTAVCTLRISESRRAKISDHQWERIAVWHRITAWGVLAERVSKIFRKGSIGLFHYRIDYTSETMKKKNGNEFEARVPTLVLVDFEPLANFGKNPQNNVAAKEHEQMTASE